MFRWITPFTASSAQYELAAFDMVDIVVLKSEVLEELILSIILELIVRTDVDVLS